MGSLGSSDGSLFRHALSIWRIFMPLFTWLISQSALRGINWISGVAHVQAAQDIWPVSCCQDCRIHACRWEVWVAQVSRAVSVEGICVFCIFFEGPLSLVRQRPPC